MAKIFLVAVIKYAAKSKLRKEGLIYFNIQFKIQSILVIMSRWREPEEGGQIPSTWEDRAGSMQAC